MSARPRPKGRKRGVLLLLIAIGVVAAGVAAENLTAPATMAAPVPEPLAEVTTGTAYCPVPPADGDAAVLEIASASTDTDSEVVVTRYVDGEPVRDDPRGIAAGASALLELPTGADATPITVEWRGAPVAVQQRLTAGGEVAVADCQTQPADRWHLAGFDTNRGSISTLYLFNPFEQDAVVDLSFGTDEGRVELVIANQIQVPAGEVVIRDLAELRPETADLAVSIEATVGRVVVQGQVQRGPAGEGLEDVTGRALVPAVADPSDLLHVANALSDDVTESWMSVYNPSERPAAVRIQVSTPLSDAGALAGELTVPAGGTVRVDLAGLSALPRMGVVLESVNGVGLVASRLSAIRDGDRTGVALAVATPVADDGWTVVGGAGPDGQLTLFNPGTAVATVRVAIGGEVPADFGSVQVPPNAVIELPLEGIEASGPARITADVPVVVGLMSVNPGQESAYWSATGIPDSALVGGGEAVRAVRDPSLATVPVRSTSATETPTPEAPLPPGEGVLDPDPTPTIVEPPETTPTPSPGVTQPPAAESTPIPTPEPPPPAAPDPQDPSPSPPPPAETEDSLFG